MARSAGGRESWHSLSPTRFAGPLTRPDPSVAMRHLPTLWGVTLTEGASKHPTT